MKTVKQMHKYAKDNNKPLLSSYPAAFWEEYRDNTRRYDSLFERLYKTFVYYDQDDDATIEEVYDDFVYQVYNHLLVNDKKYSELFRINVIDDTNYSLTNNYDMTEIMARNTDNQSATTTGQRTDINDSRIGSQNIGTVNKVTGYNSNNENTSTSGTSSNGTREDITQFTKGQETDTSRELGNEQYTLTRKGNIGVMTATDMLDKHNKFWSIWDFYSMIFGDICKELLKLGGDEKWPY